MDTLLDRIKHHFSESIQIKIATVDSLSSVIAYAGQKMVQCLLDNHKIMACGNGGSAVDALHFSSLMVNRFKHERPSLPALALGAEMASLTAIANDYDFSDVYAKQVRALGASGDLLLAISTSGDSTNILHAIRAAQDKKMDVIALTGQEGGKIVGLLGENDVEIRVGAYDTARIQETHRLIIHCLCDIVDFQLFGHGETS